MHNWIKLSFITDTSPQKVIEFMMEENKSTDLLLIRHQPSALFALKHVVIYFATDNITQAEILLIRTRHPNVEGVLSYVPNVWKDAEME